MITDHNTYTFLIMSDSYDDEDDTRKSDDDNTTESNDRRKKAGLDDVPPAKNVGRKRTIDESTLNPDDARKLETRRAYNRQCAAKGMSFLTCFLTFGGLVGLTVVVLSVATAGE